MPYPPECKMPDLSDLGGLVGRLTVQLLIGEPSINRRVSLYRRNFVRLVDKAVFEYKQAREVILDQIAEANRPAKEMMKTGRYLNIFGITNHMENCINAIHRIYKLLERIKTERESPTIPRQIRRSVETKRGPIGVLRIAAEHMDELIRRDELAPNTPIMLALTKNSDRIKISDYDIKFIDLAIVLRNMHAIGEYILTPKSKEPGD